MAAAGESSGFSSEFFKVFLAENSSTQLRFPPAFVAEGLGRRILKKNATLEDETGKTWTMVMKREQELGDLLLDDGWPEFVTGHCLVDGDFLVFRYRGNCCFNVEVFGRNGLKKKKKTNVNSQALTLKTVKQEEPIETEKQEGKQKKTEEQEAKRKVTEKQQRKEIKFAEEILVKEEQLESESSGSDWEESKRRRRSGGGRKRRRRGGQETESVNKTSGIRRGRVKEPFVQLEGPHFTVKMTKHCAYSVSVPISVLRDYNIKLEDAITLTNGDAGNSSTAFVTSRLDGRVVINTGWSNFRRENQIMFGDECVFELIVSDGDHVCREVKVHVQRGNGTPPAAGGGLKGIEREVKVHV